METTFFPPRPFFDTLVRTALWSWVGLHVALSLGAGAYGGDPLAASAITSVALVLIVPGLCRLDRRATGMQLFLANLGFPAGRLDAVALAVAGSAELALHILIRLAP